MAVPWCSCLKKAMARTLLALPWKPLPLVQCGDQGGLLCPPQEFAQTKAINREVMVNYLYGWFWVVMCVVKGKASVSYL